jgi:hypothetical protein
MLDVGEVGRGPYLARDEIEMPTDTRALTRAARERAKATGALYTTAREDVVNIRRRMDETGESYAEAEAWYDNPANDVACEACGWTNGMLCPECPGCGCYNGQCSGWRHREYMHEDDRREREEAEREANRCEECGADMSLGSYDECTCG